MTTKQKSEIMETITVPETVWYTNTKYNQKLLYLMVMS